MPLPSELRDYKADAFSIMTPKQAAIGILICLLLASILERV